MLKDTGTKTGLMLGKFMPLHKGHLALAEFALQSCDRLIILLCSSENEILDGSMRETWLREQFRNEERVRIVHTRYDEKELPNSSVSSRETSRLWSEYLRRDFPEIDVFFSSEPYGDYVAEFLGIGHRLFDRERKQVEISSSLILQDPFASWEYLADSVRPDFVKKICISGSESTGKSTLTELLASHFDTVFVPEMAREVIGKTEEVVYDDLIRIAKLHAETINSQLKRANKILLVDTDLEITRSYSQFLFGKTLEVPAWIEQANRFDLHIFLGTDCPFVQDGTRLYEEDRNRLSDSHKRQLEEAGITWFDVGGDWQQRFDKASAKIREQFFKTWK